MKRQRIICDAAKTIVSSVISLFLIAYSILFAFQGLYPGAIAFAAVGIIFLIVALYSAKSVSISEKGIDCFSLLSSRVSYKWEEIKEVGIIGTSLILSDTDGKTNRKFIYFSMQDLEENDRYKLMLKWPLKSVPFIPFNRKHYETVRLYWEKEIVFYNTGKLEQTMR